MTDDGQSERERRRRAVLEQTKRTFETTDKDYDDYTDRDSPATDIDEAELEAEIDGLEAELQDELGCNE